jgi:predicted regulator of Ras-like GTPase activity (Roadblock/LC7/MglB family)
MTVHSEYHSGGAQQFNWLLKQFATKTPEVVDAIAVSSGGLLIAMATRATATTPIGSPPSRQA